MWLLIQARIKLNHVSKTGPWQPVKAHVKGEYLSGSLNNPCVLSDEKTSYHIQEERIVFTIMEFHYSTGSIMR